MHLLLTAESTWAADVHGLALASQSETLNQLTPGERRDVAVPAPRMNSEQCCARGPVVRTATRAWTEESKSHTVGDIFGASAEDLSDPNLQETLTKRPWLLGNTREAKRKKKIKERNVAKQIRKSYEFKINSKPFPSEELPHTARPAAAYLQQLQPQALQGLICRSEQAAEANSLEIWWHSSHRSCWGGEQDFQMLVRWETCRGNEYGSSTGCKRLNLKGPNCRIATAWGGDGTTRERVSSKGGPI